MTNWADINCVNTCSKRGLKLRQDRAGLYGEIVCMRVSVCVCVLWMLDALNERLNQPLNLNSNLAACLTPHITAVRACVGTRACVCVCCRACVKLWQSLDFYAPAHLCVPAALEAAAIRSRLIDGNLFALPTLWGTNCHCRDRRVAQNWCQELCASVCATGCVWLWMYVCIKPKILLYFCWTDASST